MALPTDFTDSYLEAVNQILGACGQAPITAADTTNPEYALAYNTLIEVNRELQGKGWAFNSDTEYPLNLDVNSEILIPSNALQVKLSNTCENMGLVAVPRQGKMYDKVNHTYTWTNLPDDKLYVDIIWYYEFYDTPQTFKDYVLASASAQTCLKIVGSNELFKALKDREQQTKAVWREYETSQGGYTIFGFPHGEDYYYSYRPFRALQR